MTTEATIELEVHNPRFKPNISDNQIVAGQIYGQASSEPIQFNFDDEPAPNSKSVYVDDANNEVLEAKITSNHMFTGGYGVLVPGSGNYGTKDEATFVKAIKIKPTLLGNRLLRFDVTRREKLGGNMNIIFVLTYKEAA